MKNKQIKISVIGLGYVGIILAHEFAKKYQCIGYDVDTNRIDELNKNLDRTKQLKSSQIKKSKLKFTSSLIELKDSNIYIVTVPTPIFKNKKPDLRNLISASKDIAKILKKEDYVIYESTVFPGATEEICIPLLEKFSNKKSNKDFFVGYSPERINPSDNKKKITNINKIVASQSNLSSNFIKKLYQSIISDAEVYRAESIIIAEAAKVIENTQRDINIALMNELSLIFKKLEIDTLKVIKAASTKWNFLKFTPGLVGGHCIGVDPYYLTYKSKKSGYEPKIILSGRKLNDEIGINISKFIYSKLNKKKNLTINILGLTFKEDCNDIRNSKVFDIIDFFRNKNFKINVHDPMLEYTKIKINNYYIKNIKFSNLKKTDVLIIAVAHNIFFKITNNKINNLVKKTGIIYDIKGVLNNRKFIKTNKIKYYSL